MPLRDEQQRFVQLRFDAPCGAQVTRDLGWARR
jgi:hypothetical protein